MFFILKNYENEYLPSIPYIRVGCCIDLINLYDQKPSIINLVWKSDFSTFLLARVSYFFYIAMASSLQIIWVWFIKGRFCRKAASNLFSLKNKPSKMRLYNMRLSNCII